MPVYGGDLEWILSLTPLHESTSRTSHNARTMLFEFEELKDGSTVETPVQHRLIVKMLYVPLTALGDMRTVLTITQDVLTGKFCLPLGVNRDPDYD